MTKSTHRHLAVFDAHLAPLVSKSARGDLSEKDVSAHGALSAKELSLKGTVVAEGSTESVGDGELGEGELLQVGDLAKLSGKTVRAIHLYEDLGLLRPIDRSKGRFRLFNE